MSEPAGVVITYAGSTAPEGWLLCDGSAVSRDTYATLFDAIGTTYGVGDGSTTFNVPNLQGRVVIGVSGTHALASTGGAETVTLQTTNLPSHTHSVPKHGHANTIGAKTPTLSHTITQPVFKYNSPTGKNTGNNQVISAYSSTASTAASRATNAAVGDHAATACTMSGSVTARAAFNTQNAGTGGAHNNMQPFLAVNYIIRTGD